MPNYHTAPAHPYATDAVVYTALFDRDNRYFHVNFITTVIIEQKARSIVAALGFLGTAVCYSRLISNLPINDCQFFLFFLSWNFNN